VDAYWGSGSIAPLSLTSALDGGEWSDLRPGRLNPKKTASGTHWTGGWVGPRAVLDALVKRKITSPPRTPIQLLAQRYNDWAIMALVDNWALEKYKGSECVLQRHTVKIDFHKNQTIMIRSADVFPVWWPGNKNSPTVTHSCRKRRLKWVAPCLWGI
jgi:hypothetical protein